MVTWIDDHDDHHSALGVLRAADQPPFGQAEQIAAQSFSEHLQRALQLQNYTQNLQRKTALCTEAIDGLALSMLIVDETGTILHLNASAEHLLNSQTCALSINSGRLTATHLANKNKLAAIIAKATDNPAIGGAMFLNDERSYQLFVTPLAPDSAVFSYYQLHKALVLIMEPRKKLSMLHLQGKLYDFSPTELRVAEALLNGKTPELYAEEAAVKISTVRSQLANLFRKTNTSRQTELVALLSQMPPL
jgi:DNA-binding CsgD family transcriptional regulator